MNSPRNAAIWVLALVITAVTGCARAENLVELKGRQFKVELALTPDEQAMGLMFRESLPPEAGMLFVFGQEAPRSFWMKNTRIPLDILYFDAALRLVSVAEHARPCAVRSCPGYPSEGPARYVLELNAGQASELGLERGDELRLLFDL